MPLNDAQRKAILQIVEGLCNTAMEVPHSPALNDGDYSGYYLLGCRIAVRMKARAENEIIDPDPAKHGSNNWMDNWVYSYHDPSVLAKELL